MKGNAPRNQRIDGPGMILVALLLAGGVSHGQDFQVGTLSSDACRVSDAYLVTGDDRGGIALSRDHVFYTGDSRTGRFARSDLGDFVGFARRYDALTSNLRTGDLYSLGYGDTPITGPSSFTILSGATVTTLVEIDPISGAPTGDLSVGQETAPGPVVLGADLTYTLTLHNEGPDGVTEAALFDTLPGMLALTSVRTSPGTCETDLCGGLACALGPLDAGEVATVTLEGVPLASRASGADFDGATGQACGRGRLPEASRPGRGSFAAAVLAQDPAPQQPGASSGRLAIEAPRSLRRCRLRWPSPV